MATELPRLHPVCPHGHSQHQLFKSASIQNVWILRLYWLLTILKITLAFGKLCLKLHNKQDFLCNICSLGHNVPLTSYFPLSFPFLKKKLVLIEKGQCYWITGFSFQKLTLNFRCHGLLKAEIQRLWWWKKAPCPTAPLPGCWALSPLGTGSSCVQDGEEKEQCRLLKSLLCAHVTHVGSMWINWSLSPFQLNPVNTSIHLPEKLKLECRDPA